MQCHTDVLNGFNANAFLRAGEVAGLVRLVRLVGGVIISRRCSLLCVCSSPALVTPATANELRCPAQAVATVGPLVS